MSTTSALWAIDDLLLFDQKERKNVTCFNPSAGRSFPNNVGGLKIQMAEYQTTPLESFLFGDYTGSFNIQPIDPSLLPIIAEENIYVNQGYFAPLDSPEDRTENAYNASTNGGLNGSDGALYTPSGQLIANPGQVAPGVGYFADPTQSLSGTSFNPLTKKWDPGYVLVNKQISRPTNPDRNEEERTLTRRGSVASKDMPSETPREVFTPKKEEESTWSSWLKSWTFG